MSKKNILVLSINIVLFVLEVISASLSASFGILNNIQYFTYVSNYLLLIASLLSIIFIIIKKGNEEVPLWIKILKYVAVCSVVQNFITLFLIQIPLENGFSNYLIGLTQNLSKVYLLINHIIAPIISFLSFIILEGDRRLNKKKTIYYGMLLTVIYGIVIRVLNIFKVISGPYSFLTNNIWYFSIISLIVFVCINYILARFILLENQKRAIRNKRR